MNKHLLAYILKYPQIFLQRHGLIDIFTETERVECSDDKEGNIILDISSDPFIGMLVDYKGEFCAITDLDKISDTPDYTRYKVKLDHLGFKSTTDILAKPTDEFILRKGDIANYKDNKDIVTTLGRYIVNYTLLVSPFGDSIPYINSTLKGAKKLESAISDKLLSGEITAEGDRKYGSNILFLSSNPEYFAPTITRKALSTGANVKKRKAELLEENKEAIANNDVVKLAEMEKTLVDLDTEYLKGDPSNIFLMKAAYRNNIRKKLYLIHGAIPAFGRKGEYDFIPNSLEEGWTVNSFGKIVNEVRDGTHARSTEVAKGGEESNFILRVFQDTRITELDCKTKHGRPVYLHATNYKEYINRNILVDGKTIALTAENIKSYIGKTVSVRSPMYCKGRNGGICYKCTSKRYEETKQDTLATIMNALGAMFSTLALKKVHNTAVASTKLLGLDNYMMHRPTTD